MRNWNKPLDVLLFPKPKVLSLPMRNWNRTSSGYKICPWLRFEPTYEELKRVICAYKDGWNECFEPTYEELKRTNTKNTTETTTKFWAYLWGIETKFTFFKSHTVCGFWAYLWGIETRILLHCIYLQIFVLSLPMRNWNLYLLPKIAEPFFVLSLPMRNWNPRYIKKQIPPEFRFEPTYEELKPGIVEAKKKKKKKFWAYLWGIETCW